MWVLVCSWLVGGGGGGGGGGGDDGEGRQSWPQPPLALSTTQWRGCLSVREFQSSTFLCVVVVVVVGGEHLHFFVGNRTKLSSVQLHACALSLIIIELRHRKVIEVVREEHIQKTLEDQLHGVLQQLKKLTLEKEDC